MFLLLIAGFMLNNMFSGRSNTQPDADGFYPIYRDGRLFQYIYFYLHTGILNVQRDRYYKIFCRYLRVEAKFYGIKGMIKDLEEELQPFNDSVILSSHQAHILMKGLRQTPGFFNSDELLLYRASRDDWSSVNFHSCCDYKGPTVTVIKSDDNIFGGFTEQSWVSKF